MIAKDRAASRFLQIADLEDTIRRAERGLEELNKELDDVKSRRDELLRVKRDALDDIRQAARDQGQLPLFADLDHALSVAAVGVGA